MNIFSYFAMLVLISLSAIGYRLSLSSPLLGALITQRLSCRLSEFGATLFILLLAVASTPHILLSLLPFPVIMLCFTGRNLLKKLQRTKNESYDRDAQSDLVETAFNTAISVCSLCGFGLLLLSVLTRVPYVHDRCKISFGDECLIHAMLLGVCTVLLFLFASAIISYWKNPSERCGVKPSLIRLKQKLKDPPNMI